MDHTRRVYRLSPSQLSAETIAVTFAKTSRSPEPFDAIAAELDAEKSARFSEKWIVGYGHSSVAEHAVLHLALENVSRMSIETIEANRLASYTEKSSRYQLWDPKAYVTPPELEGSPFHERYIQVMNYLFAVYAESLDWLIPWGEANIPRQLGEGDKAWANRARLKSVDVARFLLPAAATANVGITINARALEYAIRKMLSSPLAEVRAIGQEVKRVANEELPTLVKYADPIESLAGVRDYCRRLTAQVDTIPSDRWCVLRHYDPNAEDKILAAILFRFGDDSVAVCLDQVLNMPAEDRQKWLDRLFDQLDEHDVPLRELEYSNYVFELVMDQGAYFEFKRHRMMTQTAQTLTADLGYAIPRAITEAGFEPHYRKAMDLAGRLFRDMVAWNPDVAAYVVPNAFNRRVLCSLNLREMFHFIRLRCAENAHFSIRRVGRGMFEALESVHPSFAGKIKLKLDERSDTLAEKYFTALEESIQ